jgi:uncharacterized protein (TIGR03437 family)
MFYGNYDVRNWSRACLGLLLALPVWAQTISTVGGNTSWGRPITVRLDAAGNLYTTDFDNHVVYKVDTTGAPTIVAGTYKKAGSTGDGGLATSALLNNPCAVAPAPDGTLYITEYSGNRIRKVDTKGIITTLVGPTAGFSGDGQPASGAAIRNPLDIVVDSGGNIWFIDSNNNRIRKITPAGTINTVAGFGTAAYSGDGASALQAGMQPGAMALGPNGSLYFTDAGVAGQGASYRVRMVNGSGTISTIAGGKGTADAGDGGPATSAGLSSPDGVAIDSAGNVYIAEAATNKIRKVSPGGTITTYAGTGSCCSTGDGGPAIQATFNYPRGMAVDAANNLYIADSNSDKIRKISGSPAIENNGVVNGASFSSGGIVPGEIATVFGANLTTGTGINLASALPLATTLLSVQVMVNGTAAPIFAVDNVNGQEQINFQVPYEVAGQATATLQVVNNGSPGNTLTVPVMPAQPGIFTYTIGTTNFGAILHASYQLANTSAPATGGETVLIYCTGLGTVSPTPSDGASAAGSATTTLTPTVTIGGATAAIAYSGLAPGFVGLYQINVQVPMGLSSGNQPVVITIGGVQSSIALLPVQ